MKKILMIFTLFSSASFASFTIDLTDPRYIEIADMYPFYEELTSMSFSDTGNGLSILAFKSEKNTKEWDVIFSAKIANSKEGLQKIYITLSTICTDKEIIYDSMTIKTNGQNVRFSKFCNGKNFYITPLSRAGDNFLVNEFKKKDNVLFEFDDLNIIFDATGFTKAWDEAGGDAL